MTWLFGYLLRVLQVTRIVVGNPQRDGVARRPRFKLTEHFGNVTALGGERFRFGGVVRIVSEQMAVILKC